MTKTSVHFGRVTLDDLEIEDEVSFRHVAVYADLAEVLRRERYAFRTLPPEGASWDRALFLNLTFWGANEGGDVLVDAEIPADVVAHVAWHQLATKHLSGATGARPPVDALFLGEAIASAFDLYLVGRLLGHAPKSTFLATQVPAMADVAAGAGLDEDAFAAMLDEVTKDPERAFGDLRALLFDATRALFDCADPDDALTALSRFGDHRFGALLHHYELSNWVLYARAYGDAAPHTRSREVDVALREAKDPVAWLVEAWLKPALA